MIGVKLFGSGVLTLIAGQTPPGSAAVPWWLRFGVIVYGALLVAAFMMYAQTKHQRPWSVLWVLIIGFVPILGAIAYFVAQTVAYRRSGARPTKARAETMAPEEYRDDGPAPGRTSGRTDSVSPDTGGTDSTRPEAGGPDSDRPGPRSSPPSS